MAVSSTALSEPISGGGSAEIIEFPRVVTDPTATGPGIYPDDDRPANRADYFGGLHVDGGRFFVVSDVRAYEWAIEGPAALSLPWRLFFLAGACADADGVARFRTGEIAQLLRVTRPALGKATKIGRDTGLLGAGSGSTKLVKASGATDRKISSKRAGRHKL